jgi:hypothetical protein
MGTLLGELDPPPPAQPNEASVDEMHQTSAAARLSCRRFLVPRSALAVTRARPRLANHQPYVISGSDSSLAKVNKA